MLTAVIDIRFNNLLLCPHKQEYRVVLIQTNKN